jgi:iron(III) transport system ATP-binding protein
MPDLTPAPAADLRARGVTLALGGAPVLRGVDLDVTAGRVVALLGPSGCGKTTLLRVLAGLERPDAGTVALGDRTLTDGATFVPPERRRIGMVFQDWALFPHLTVGGNVGFGLPRADRRAGAEAALVMVELAGFAERMPATLSGGQQQRVALARTLAHRPAAVLLDEPFSNLDTTLRLQVRGEVTRLLRGLGMTALFVTHDQEEAFVLGDEVAVMLAGRIEQQAPPAELYAAPATRAVAAFVGDANLLPGLAAGDQADTALGALPLHAPASGRVDVLVRPEHVRVGAGDQGHVRTVEFYGHDAMYVVGLDGGPEVRCRIADRPSFRPGDTVSLNYAGGATIAYPAA